MRVLCKINFSNSPQRNLNFCALRSLFLICSGAHGQALIIGNEMLNTDPLTQDEMARKKEKIMMQSLRRKQAAEENRIRHEEELRKRREEEAKAEEEKVRKKEEEKAKREAILEQVHHSRRGFIFNPILQTKIKRGFHMDLKSPVL